MTAEHGQSRVAETVPGLELLTSGGLTRNRLTVVSGTAGSGKTVFASQFLASGIAAGEAGVFVTFEEPPASIRTNIASFGWDVAAWESEGRWAFVDASPDHAIDVAFSGGGYDLNALLARVLDAVSRTGATRVAIDSVGALITQLDQTTPARAALFRLAAQLQAAGVTTLMTAERPEDYGPIARHGFEEYVADNVIILRNALEGERRRRTVEVLKMRGAPHARGEHLFTLLPGRGIVVIPVSIATMDGPASTTRLTSGIAELDRMCGGGFFQNSLVLVSGATGTGKSLLSTHFVAGTEGSGRALLQSFEESRAQLLRNAASWGIDLARLEDEGRLRILAATPEETSLEDHLQRLKYEIDSFAPDRVAIDSLTALQRVATIKSFREYVLGLTFHIKHRCQLGLVTTTASNFLDDERLSHELHVSTISDTIVLLHYVADGQLKRGINVLKMRGSAHDTSLRELQVSGEGATIGAAFPDVGGLLRS